MSGKDKLLVAGIILAIVIAWFVKQNPQLNDYNAILQADTEIQSYPYQVHVLHAENGVVTLSSPRSPQVSVLHFLSIAFPNLNTSNPDSPEMIAAQKQLAHIQEKAFKLIKSQPDVKEVQWEIDRNWYERHGLKVE